MRRLIRTKIWRKLLLTNSAERGNVGSRSRQFSSVVGCLVCPVSSSRKHGGGLTGFRGRFSREPMLHFLTHPLRSLDRTRGGRDGTFAIRVRKKDSIQRLAYDRLGLGKQPGRRHIKRMAATVDVHLNRINIRSRKKLLEIPQYIFCDSTSTRLAQKLRPLILPQWRIAAQNVVFRFISGLLANDP